MNNTNLFGSALVLSVGITVNDIYLLIVATGILISSVIAIINAVKDSKKVEVDNDALAQLKEIQRQLDEKKDDNDDSLQQ